MTQNLRVVHVVDSLGDGGAARLEVTFARAAADRRMELTVAHLGGCELAMDAAITAAGGRVVDLAPASGGWRRRVGPIAALTSVLRTARADVVQTSLAWSNIVGAAAARATSTPQVAVLHATFDETARHTRRMQALETLALRHGAARIVAVGQSVGTSHERRLRGRLIETVTNPVERLPALDGAARHAARAELDIDDDRPVVICVARLVPQKAHLDLLEAFAVVCQHRPDAVLLLVGDGPERSSIEREVRRLGLGDQAVLARQRPDVARLLGAADVFVSSSHWEGTPLAVLEAMSAGLPIVATSVGELPYLLADGRGELVPPSRPDQLAAALLRAVQDPGAARCTGRAGAAYVHSEHTPEQWVDRLERIYDEVADRPAVGV